MKIPITTINVEINNTCNKNCWCCGRRKTEQQNPDIIKTYGNMPLDMVKHIAEQIPDGVYVHLHNNGEPLLYPEFGKAVECFNRHLTHITTNGKLLIEKFNEIQELTSIAISVIENDPEADQQYEIMKEYFSRRYKPLTTIRLNGNVDDEKFKVFNVPIVRRILHSPMGSFNYTHRTTLPETGICWDMLYHPAINKDGDVSICVRYDPERLGVIGNVKEKPLMDILYGKERMLCLLFHIAGKRDEVPLCKTCEYWGIPKGV